MKILFTGASSFTGYWFVRELAEAGHDVTAIFRGRREDYEGVRRERVEGLVPLCDARFECQFGSAEFLDLIASQGRWDVLCHHAAEVSNYKSPDFDVVAAVANNTAGLPAVMDAMGARGCRRLLLTGSVFEGGEGAGSEGLPAFSPYGVSKELTARICAYHTWRQGWHLGKFVVPNPFGPLEEPRFTAYLMRCWANGEAARVNTPDYVRDNIHVSLLARAYAAFAGALGEGAGSSHCSPSGYVESQGRFAERLASEMRSRLGLPCELHLADQVDFDEPRLRINTQPVDGPALGWQEAVAWDELADYYAGVLNLHSKDVRYA